MPDSWRCDSSLCSKGACQRYLSLVPKLLLLGAASCLLSAREDPSRTHESYIPCPCIQSASDADQCSFEDRSIDSTNASMRDFARERGRGLITILGEITSKGMTRKGRGMLLPIQSVPDLLQFPMSQPANSHVNDFFTT